MLHREREENLFIIPVMLEQSTGRQTTLVPDRWTGPGGGSVDDAIMSFSRVKQNLPSQVILTGQLSSVWQVLEWKHSMSEHFCLLITSTDVVDQYLVSRISCWCSCPLLEVPFYFVVQ